MTTNPYYDDDGDRFDRLETVVENLASTVQQLANRDRISPEEVAAHERVASASVGASSGAGRREEDFIERIYAAQSREEGRANLPRGGREGHLWWVGSWHTRA